MGIWSSLIFGVWLSIVALAQDPQVLAKERLRSLALSQTEKISQKWSLEQRDCAGFVRFLFREAVTAKTKMWNTKAQKLAEYVSAPELISHNFSSVQFLPDLSDLQTGDLLAFFDSEKEIESAWHLMVVLDSPVQAVPRKLVIYHNGATGAKAEIRKIWIDELSTTRSRWQPVKTNPYFRGVYRWSHWLQEKG